MKIDTGLEQSQHAVREIPDSQGLSTQDSHPDPMSFLSWQGYEDAVAAQYGGDRRWTRNNQGEWAYLATRPSSADTVAGRAAAEARRRTQGPPHPAPLPPPPWSGNDRCPVCDSSACETGCEHSRHSPCQQCQHKQQRCPPRLSLQPSPYRLTAPPPNVELLGAGTDPDQRLMLLALQHNVGRMAEALVSVMETAARRKAEPVLIQDPPQYQGSSHPAYDYLWSGGRLMTARRKDSD